MYDINRIGSERMSKETKTNAMRILDKLKIKYSFNTYECDEFIDAIHIADMLGQSCEKSFKTIVCVGKSGDYFVCVVPIDKSIDLKKAAKSVGEKSAELIPVKDINKVTGYIRGGCTPIGMKKQYRTVIHKSAQEFNEIIISGGRIGLQINIAPDDLCRAVGGKYDDIILE